ncbi:MAG: hypothetical protein JWN54_237 [Mycobacterium sp.]|jgi:hypothetical protein|nr:hypothetical protein [Mycobacterium sp.]
MAHIPVDHPLRGLYRAVATIIGFALLVIGVIGLVKTAGSVGFFATHGERILGLTLNPAFAVLNIVAGAVIAGAGLMGRNWDATINLLGGILFLLAGGVMLCVLRTDLNILAFSITNVCTSFVIGTVLMAAGLYGRTSTTRKPVATAARA